MEGGATSSWAPGLEPLLPDEEPLELLFRERDEDFVVHELPAVEPEGEGEHLWVEVEKRGFGTPELLGRVRRTFGLEGRDIGYAGRKDARAVTRQWLSLRGVDEARLPELEARDLRVLQARLHRRKLRLGQLLGNRFDLVLRGPDASDRDRLLQRLEPFLERGLPNAFGPQRFGRDGRAWERGRELLTGGAAEYLRAWTDPVTRPPSSAVEELHAALCQEERGAWRRCAALVPRLPADLRPLARQMARRPGDWRSALRALDPATLRFHLSAWQSRVFNRLLGLRGERYDRPLAGDLCTLAEGRSLFAVGPGEDLLSLEQRARAGELTPTGPLPGSEVPWADGEPGELEQAALAAEELPEGREGPFTVAALTKLRLPGARRPLRVPILDPVLTPLAPEETGEGQRLAFSLPPGSFATALLFQWTHGWGPGPEGPADRPRQGDSGRSRGDPGAALQSRKAGGR